jgi:hypothetical protein
METLSKRKFLLSAFVSMLSHPLLARSQSSPRNSGHLSLEFVNGQWFDGSHFRRQVFYSVDGLLTQTRPSGEVDTVDLANGFAVPPFAEAHNHNLGSAIFFNPDSLRGMIQRYLTDGVFYVKIPGNDAVNAAILRREFVNRRDSVDVAYSNGVLTSRDGHPIGMTLESFKEAGLAVPDPAEFEGKLFFLIESEADLLADWERILAGKPDFIKTILCHSQNFAERRATPSLFGSNGLNPRLMPRIVEQAHAAGLRVSAHVYSAFDFATAVRAGADEINHLPGIRFEDGTSEADYLIAAEDAEHAARQGTIVVTTAGLAKFFAKEEALPMVQAAQRKNLQLLKEKGVRIAVGSDNYASTSTDEVMYLKSLDVFDNAELLGMWSVTAAQTIFPNRRIGYLREGYEASFIVLRGNPLEDFERVRDIRLRFKQGALVTPAG